MYTRLSSVANDSGVSKKMAQFGPESVAHFAPEWVAYFGSEWVAQFGPEYARFLDTLIYKKMATRIDPDGHSFVIKELPKYLYQ